MDDAGFQDFAHAAEQALEQKNAAIHHRYGLDRAVRWNSDEPMADAPKFQIWDASDQLLFGCVGLEVGTFSPVQSSWKWGWANGSLSEAHRGRLLPLRELAGITGQPAFGSENPFEVDIDTAWSLAAISVEYLQAAGCYPAKIENKEGEPLRSYLAYIDVAQP